MLFAIPSYAYASTDTEFYVKILIGLFILVIIFLVLREVLCWYWKINERLAILEEVRDLLSKIYEKEKSKKYSDIKIKDSLSKSNEDRTKSIDISDSWPADIPQIIEEKLNEVKSGDVLKVIADLKPYAKKSVSDFLQKKGYHFDVIKNENEKKWEFFIAKT